MKVSSIRSKPIKLNIETDRRDGSYGGCLSSKSIARI